MKTQKNNFGVISYLGKYKAAKSGKAPIYVRITVNGHRTDLSVKRSVDASNWNENKGMAKGKREEITKLNKYLEEYRQFDIFRLKLVKDLFAFSCYTGLAYRDVFNLMPENLVEWSAKTFG